MNSIDRMHQLIEALAGVSPDGLRDQGASRLMVQTDRGNVSIYTAFADWLRDRPELINGLEMRDLLSNPISERTTLFKYFASHQAAFEVMNNVTH